MSLCSKHALADLKAVALLLDQPDSVFGKVGNNQIGPGALNGREDFHDHALLIEPAELSRGFDHGVFPRDRVGSQREPELLPDPSDHVQVGQRGFHHDDIGPLIQIEPHLADRLGCIGRIHLIGAPIAELRGRVGRLAERAVEARCILGGIGHDRGFREA